MMRYVRLLSGKKFKYLGQCDRLRRQSEENEKRWHQMMADKKKILVKKFKQLADYQAMLDEDETLEEYMADDPTSATYKSKWGNIDAVFLQHAGFEFIFTDK